MQTNQAERPYWLSGEESCAHCHHLYAYAVEARCSSCDEGVCPHCVVMVSSANREVLCPVCHAFHPAEEGP